MNNIKQLPSLLVFAEVAKYRSFTKAALKLGLSKSAVSQHIKRLEQQANIALLSRHTRAMNLTAAGQKLIQRCALLSDQVELAFEEIASLKEEPSGPFSITLPHSCQTHIVMPAITQLCKEFPKIQPHIMTTDHTLDLLDNNLDVAIHGGKLKDSNYRALPLGVMKEILCASEQYLANNLPIVDLQQLTTHKIIINAWQSDQITLYDSENPEQPLNIAISPYASANNLPASVELVKNQMGIALLPIDSVQKELASGAIKQVLEKYRGATWPFHMVHKYSADKPVHVERFYQLVKYHFQLHIPQGNPSLT